jgi:hypothetical protein
MAPFPENNPLVDDLSDALKWVYEYTPCTFCRYKAEKQLMEFNSIDMQIAQEILFDANEDIRELAEKNSRLG